jgi:hypothetical protein
MEVFRHKNILVEQVSPPTIRLKSLKEKLSPLRILEQRSPLPGLRGNEVRVT